MHPRDDEESLGRSATPTRSCWYNRAPSLSSIVQIRAHVRLVEVSVAEPGVEPKNSPLHASSQQMEIGGGDKTPESELTFLRA